MKNFFVLILLLSFTPLSLEAHRETVNTTASDPFKNVWYLSEKKEQPHQCDRCANVDDDNDPFEPVNRGIYAINCIVDHILLEPIAVVYKEVFPEFIRMRIGYILRNLSEPIVFANNLLQGNPCGAEDALRRFILNSTVGLAGIFDVSTDYGIPYKRVDFGMTLASWGAGPGPYIVLPILGPSSLRDGVGRGVDYGLDPINWFSFGIGGSYYSHGRTSSQIIDAKTDTLEISQDLKENSVDPYAASRAWFREYRKSQIEKASCQEHQALDTPRPSDDDED